MGNQLEQINGTASSRVAQYQQFCTTKKHPGTWQ